MPSDPRKVAHIDARFAATKAVNEGRLYPFRKKEFIAGFIEGATRAPVVADPDAAKLRCRKCGDTYDVKFSYPAPVSPTTASKCVKCGHGREFGGDIECQAVVDLMKGEQCGCNCEFEGDSNA